MKIMFCVRMVIFLIFILLFDFCFLFCRGGFEENKGQIVDEFGRSRDDVFFVSRVKDCKILLTERGISYQFDRVSGEERVVCNVNMLHKLDGNLSLEDLVNFKAEVDVKRVDVEFLGSNKGAKVIARGMSRDYNNYVRAKMPEPEQIITHFYDTVIYKDVYDGIDVVFYSVVNQENGVVFKYDFVVGSKGDISKIRMRYRGVDDICLENDVLLVSIGDLSFSELIPESYLSDGSQLSVDYEIGANEVGYLIGEESKYVRGGYSLTIDPYFIYSSYYGGSSEDVGMEIASDTAGNYFVGGYTNSTSNIATSGAYQTTMRGEKDAFVIMFSKGGERQWCTYFGGGSFDFGHTLDCDKSGNVYLGGWTQSRSGMATLGSFQYFYGGGEFDAFIAKFSSEGRLLWSTYFGGQFEDYINDLVIDGSGDIVFTGRTSSSTNIATGGAFQTEFGGNYDMFLQKFTSDGYRLWGTFYGGEGFDVGMEVCTDIFNNIMFTGFTQSRSSMASPGAFKDTLSGIWDAFVGKFDSFGKRLWGTYYGGNSEDNGWGIGSDGNGDIYVTGHTASNEGISSVGAHKRYLTNDELDAFVVKFSKSGVPQWGTYYGGDGEEYGNCGAIDAWGNFVVSGNTLSDTGIVSSDAPQSSRSSLRDAFLSKFNSAGQMLFGTYFGGNGNDYGHGVVVDKEGRLLMTGYSYSTNLVTTLDAEQSSFGGGTDAYVFKLGDAMPLDSIFTEDFKDSLCADSDILISYRVNNDFAVGNVFVAQLSDMKGMFREYYNIGILNSRTSGTITGRIPREVLSGNKYRIRVVGTSPKVIGDDNGFDINIYELPKVEISGQEKVCEFQEARYGTIEGEDLYYNWYVTGGIITSSTVMSEVDVLWGVSSNASLKVVVTNSITGCVDSAEYMVTVYPALRASDIHGAEYVCPNNVYSYYSTREEGIENKWEVMGGRIVGDSTGDDVMVYWEEPKFDGVKTGLVRLIQVVTNTGCRDTSEKVVYKWDLPKPFISGDSVSASNSVKIYRTISSSKYSYFWAVEGGEIESGGSSNQCYVRWQAAGKGSVCLHLRDRGTDCEDSVRLDVVIRDDAGSVISGSKRVCGNSEEVYSVSDTLYRYVWRVLGGELISGFDSTGMKVGVRWFSYGTVKQGCLFLFRENRNNGLRDTLVLDIEIMVTPLFSLRGNDLVCEGVIGVYRSDRVLNSINSWNVSNGVIFGDVAADSIVVFWEADGVGNSDFRIEKVVLTKTDTTSFCSAVKEIEVRVNRTERVSFMGDTVACENELKVYTSESMGGNLVYSWHIAGGIIVDNSGDTSIVVKWGKQGKGYVQIVGLGGNGCSDSLMRTVTVNKSPDKPVISQIGKTLVSSAEEGNQWYVDGELIAGATAKEYTPDRSGLYTVQVTNSMGCLSEMSSPFNFDLSLIIDNFSQNDVVFFPNPVDDILSISVNLLKYSGINIELYDLLGNKLYSGSFSQENILLDLSGYAFGGYILRYESSEMRGYRVLIKSE